MTRGRAPRDSDLAVLTELRNDLPTQYALLASPRPNTERDVRAWLERRTGDPAALFVVLADHDDAPVGFAQVLSIDERSRYGWFGIAVAAHARGRGHGREGTLEMLRLARADGRLDKLLLLVAVDNAAHGLYRGLGFRDVGILERHYRGPERWHDVALMERFLEEAA